MSDFTNILPAQSYPDLLSLNNSVIGTGMTETLVNVQDGLGHNSPMQISTNAVNFNTTGGNTFQFNGVPFVVSNPAAIDDLTSDNPNFSFTNTAVELPTGNTSQRPGSVTGGLLRYNTDNQQIETYNTDSAVWSYLLEGTGNYQSNLSAVLGFQTTNIAEFSFTNQALGLPVGNTAERPGSPQNGYIRYNTDLDSLESYYSEAPTPGWYELVGLSAEGDQILADILGVGIDYPNSSDFSFFTTAIQMPVGNTAQRPGMLEGGAIRYNTDSDSPEVYIETLVSPQWENIVTLLPAQELLLGEIVGIGTVYPGTSDFSSLDTAIQLPTGSTAERPGTVTAGAIRYNTQTNVFEGYTNAGWKTFTVT